MKNSIPDICERLLRDITDELKEKYSDKIIFAVCINETECWLLPLFYNDKRKCSTTGCIGKINNELRKEGMGIPDKAKNSDGAIQVYNHILKRIKKRKDIQDISAHNYGFNFFIKQLDQVK